MSATSLPACTWAKAGGPRVGQVVASLGPDLQPLHFAAVGATKVSNPAVRGFLPINGKEKTPEALAGLVFTEVWKTVEADSLRERLKPGDLITHVDDILAARSIIDGKTIGPNECD